MKKTIIVSAAMLIAMSASSFAALPTAKSMDGVSVKKDISDLEAKRRKPRVPKGSGCDDPRDVFEHPECRV